MRAIEILRREHGWITEMTECLEWLVGEARASGLLPSDAYDLLRLCEAFADGRHQAKEEEVLFPELLTGADDGDRRVLGRLLADHEAERARMATMRLNLLGAVGGEPLCVRAFAHAAADYAELHRCHMQREAAMLFPMAERLLGPEADERVAARFDALEGGHGDPRALVEQIQRIRRRAGLPTPPAA
jgi:hemerythrin-like domain-containing protein